LQDGNRRFVAGRSKHDHTSPDWRQALVAEQHPFAVVVGCSDSRVPPELIFDQGFGDLFVIRNAGNLIATDVVASIEYALVHLACHLVVIMGHEGCGAITAALQSRDEREREPLELQATLRMLEVALSGEELHGPARQRVLAAVESNVRFGIKQLRYLAAERDSLTASTAEFVGAVYEMGSGNVRFLG
jgi:carbonic anhydrase